MSSGGQRVGWVSVVVAAALLVSRPAVAQLSIWDQARDPHLARAEHVLHGVERMLLRAQEAQFAPDMQADFTRSALAMLELAGGSELPDVRLRYLLGDLLVDPAIGRYGEAARLLQRALREAPEHPLAAQGWFDLAIAEAKLHKPKLEIDAYNHALERAWQPELRANIFMNRGESRMVLGHLQGALSDYRRGLQIAQRPALRALAYYGLGITLERSGDLPSALDAMHKANAIQVQTKFGMPGSALDSNGVFFVPSYDLFYYEALAWMAYARDARAPAKKVERLERAISYWKRYLAQAEPDQQPWVEHAKLLLDSCRRQLAKATVEAKGSRKRAAH
jgi:tetratricopeptide (TPR) repeat protein